MGPEKRSFVLEGSAPLPHQGGRYIAKKPSIGGQHAAHQLFRMAAKDPKFARFKNADEMFVKIRETTRGLKEPKPVFHYKVTREKRTGEAAKPREFRKPDGSVQIIEPAASYAVVSIGEEEFNRNLKRAV